VIPEGGSLQSLHKPCGFLLFYFHPFRKQAFFGDYLLTACRQLVGDPGGRLPAKPA
jgi:hypothetical protein